MSSIANGLMALPKELIEEVMLHSSLAALCCTALASRTCSSMLSNQDQAWLQGITDEFGAHLVRLMTTSKYYLEKKYTWFQMVTILHQLYRSKHLQSNLYFEEIASHTRAVMALDFIPSINRLLRYYF